MKKYKTKLNRETTAVLLNMLDYYTFGIQGKSLATMMHTAILVVIANDLERKLSDRFKKDVSINWQAHEALAMQLFFFREIDINNTVNYYTNQMMRMSREIDQMYS